MVTLSDVTRQSLEQKYDISRLTELIHHGLRIAEARSAQWEHRLNLLGVMLTVEMACNPEMAETPCRPIHVPVSGDEVAHAEPLMPLHIRDLQALNTLFYREDIGEIEANVQERLESLCPEPCWDEDLYEFLQDFL